MRRRLSLLVLLCAAVPADASASVERGVAFGRADGQVLRMDIHAPRRGNDRMPAIVWIHGGGFTHGHRRRAEPFVEAFARRGYLAATIDYRLFPGYDVDAPGRPHPVRAAQHDAQAAVRFLRRHAPRLGIDAGRIYAAGSSAGAITALNVALHPDDPGSSGNPGVSSRVRAAVSIAGFAPVTAVPPGSPPLLLLHGTADRTIPFARAEETCRLALAGGTECRLVPFAGMGHGLTWQRTAELAGRAARWLDRHR